MLDISIHVFIRSKLIMVELLPYGGWAAKLHLGPYMLGLLMPQTMILV